MLRLEVKVMKTKELKTIVAEPRVNQSGVVLAVRTRLRWVWAVWGEKIVSPDFPLCLSLQLCETYSS